MKKDRNSFFSQFGSYGYNNQPMPTMPNMNMNMNPMPNMNGSQNYNMESDLESRISKLEREITRLDARLSKL